LKEKFHRKAQNISALLSKWRLLLKIEISLFVIFCFITNQNELKFNCSYMAMSSLTYILLKMTLVIFENAPPPLFWQKFRKSCMVNHGSKKTRGSQEPVFCEIFFSQFIPFRNIMR
jgi:hypothetical protein